MPDAFPYVHSPGPLLKTIEHLRRSFPKEVNAETLKKLGVAPNNESYVINVLRFLNLIDDEGKKVADSAKALLQNDEGFASEFAKLVRDAYKELFELRGDDAWTLDRDALTQFFRTTDQSSEVVGRRQATTFACLAGLSGHSELPSARERPATNTPRKAKSPKPPKAAVTKDLPPTPKTPEVPHSNFGLTVRVEVNLPADGDQQTYDRIFQSIRKNLIDAKSD